MAERKEEIMDEAINWTVRLRNGTSGQWEEFTDWLESDPAHSAAYDEVALLDSDLGEIRPPAVDVPADVDASPPSRRRWAFGGAAVAAAAVAAFGALTLAPAASDPYMVQTAPGERQSLTLAGGSVIQLNGATQLLLDRADPRSATLVSGEALFSVVHDPARPFRVEAGSAIVRNLGTVFNVRHDRDFVAVEVAEGAVSFKAAGQELTVAAGEAVRMDDGELEKRRRPADTVAGWRSGELSYSSASLGEVARDLSRSSGQAVRADPSVEGRTFSGTIVLGEDREQLRRRLSALLDVDINVVGNDWILAAPDR